MDFKGFSTDILQGMQRWNLPPETIRELSLSLMPMVDSGLAATVTSPEGVWFGSNFADPVNIGHRYYVDLRLEADLNEFWAVYIRVQRYNEEDHLMWSEECPRQSPPPSPPIPV
jgi:hypothetical protein